MSYVSNRNLTNVVGRIDYISNSDRQENIIDFCNLQNNDFWVQLAQENQEQFKASSNSKRANRKAAEAREFIIALPQDIDTTNLAETLCLDFKNKYGVDCACAIHYKAKENNLHAHLIYSERERLSEPLIVEQKVAPRTYYYDAQGKKCKKADAVKVVPKGTITQKGCTRYFGNKIDFFNMNFVKEYKAHLENELDLPKFDNTRYFATKHIGKNNPKSEFISKYNELIGELNNYFDLAEQHYDFGQVKKTPKEIFCELAGKNKFYVPEIADIKEIFAEFVKEYPLPSKVAENRFESLTEQELVETYIDLKEDINWDFKKYDCPYQHLEKYAVWEQNGKTDWVYKKDFFTKEYEFVSDDKQINFLIEKYELPINKINSNESRSVAYQIATKVLDLLKDLLSYLKELVGIENIETIENELKENDISDSFY